MSGWDISSGVSDPFSASSTDYVDQYVTLELTSAPTVTLITTSNAKLHLRIDHDADDTWLSCMITTCQNIVEKMLGGIALTPRTYTQKQRGGVSTIQLLNTPVIGTPTVSYYEDFTTVTATNITATSHFRVVGDTLYHATGYFTAGREGDGYTIEYDAGYASDSTDPILHTCRAAMVRLIAFMYENRADHLQSQREDEWQAGYKLETLPYSVRQLLMPIHSGRGLL